MEENITSITCMKNAGTGFNLKSIIIGGLVSVMILNSHSSYGEYDQEYSLAREKMVSSQIERRGITDSRVLTALRRVPRHLFVPPVERKFAYSDHPLPIGFRQTISQPYIVACMSELLELKGNEKVLEIGTGSGYQAAVLAEIGCTVYSIEIIKELALRAQTVLGEMSYENIHIKVGDGNLGWEEHAPFDAIIVTAAADEIPPMLLEQLMPEGRMVIPVDVIGGYQMLKVIGKTSSGTIQTKDIIPVRFVPLVNGSE